MEYKKNDIVQSSSKWSNGKEGFVHNVYEYGVSVNFGTKDNPKYEVFHFKPTHHTQTNINCLELLQRSKTVL
jgi:hypothetical protein